MSTEIVREETLIDLQLQANEIEYQLLETGGELTPELEAWIAHIETSLAKKGDQYKFVMDRLNDTARTIKYKAAQFEAIAVKLEATAELMKNRIKDAMIAMDKNTIEGRHYTYRLSESAPKFVFSEPLIPDRYKKQIVITELDKEEIRADLKAGILIPGVEAIPVKRLTVRISK